MASAAVQIQAITKVLPALQIRRNSKRSALLGTCSSPGLRLSNDRLALRSAFYNGGSTLAVPEVAGGTGGRITMRVAAKGAYICQDCGYIYTDRKPFDQLSSDYSCPVCAAPKRRFKRYEAPVAKNANDQAVRKARKAEIKKANDALGSALPIGIAVGVVALVGTFVYLNSVL